MSQISSYSFSIEIVDEDEVEEERPKARQSIIYQALQDQKDTNFDKVIELQQLIKSQTLLLQYQQKRKNERVKEIDYNYMNSFTNFLWAYKGNDKKGHQFILLNSKDLISLHQQLPDALQILSLFKRILDQAAMPFNNEVKPSLPFISDLMNFWPHWHLRIRQIIQLQLNSADKVQSCFESEYTFASKVLANLRFNYKIQRFCAQIFQGVLDELESIDEELNVDFAGLYERWCEQIQNLPQLKRFLDGGDAELHFLKRQIELVFGKMKSDQEFQRLIEETVQFQRKQTSMKFLQDEVGEDQIPEGLNLRLAWLVWKKILEHRKKLENLATSLLASIIEAYQRIPSEVKFVVRCFKEEVEARFGALRFEDLKSFFNKVIFSQLFFSEFMVLYEARNSKAPNTNLTLLALVAQKIMFGQQFYQKFKFGFLNPTILHYLGTVKQFIMGFTSESIRSPPTRFVNVMLTSFQGLKTVYQVVRNEIKPVPVLEIVLGNTSCHVIAGKAYDFKHIFVSLIQKVGTSYVSILKPPNKIKRTLIDFLLIIDKISEKKSLKTLIQQYKSFQQDSMINRPSVQLYAIYLQEALTPALLPVYIQEIMASIEEGQKHIQLIKIGLEKEQNYSSNLQKMYMNLLNQRRAEKSRNKLIAQINALLNANLGFNYQIDDEKIIEGGEGKTNKTFKDCLADICQSFLKNREGVDGLYHLFWERAVEELEKGVVPDNMVEKTKNIIGQKLYSMLQLSSYMSSKDKQLFIKMEKHAFITLKMLDLPQYEEEEELILRESEKLMTELSKPCCPDRILKIFHEITLIFQNVILITGSASDITADIQIPMMLVVMVRSKVRNLITLLDFVEKFCTDDIYSSVLGQTLTLMKSVIYLIEELDHKKLGLSEEEYQHLVINNSFIMVE